MRVDAIVETEAMDQAVSGCEIDADLLGGIKGRREIGMHVHRHNSRF
jgi:hypothetical protein